MQSTERGVGGCVPVKGACDMYSVADYRYSQVHILDFANETALFEHKTGKP